MALTLAMLLTACGSEPSTAQADPVAGAGEHRVETVVGGLEHPWGMAFLPDGGMLVTERPGRLRMVREGRLLPEPIAGVPEVWANGQGGLLDVALHPQFAQNRLVYLSYSKPGGPGATTAVVRGRLEDGRLADVEEVFEADAWSDRRVHFGSRMAFDDQGYLFVSIGDRGYMERAQDLSNHAGTIVRLHDDGRVPADNPFVDRPGARPEIWAYGLRSPQGLAFHPTTGELWETEHGPRGGDELNHILPGRNYGWPTITYGINYDGTPITDITEKEGMEQPVHYWVPSIATSGLAIYHGDRFPAWQGDMFTGGLAGMHLARVDPDAAQDSEPERLLEGRNVRVRDVRQGPDGNLYVLTDMPENAELLRIEPQ